MCHERSSSRGHGARLNQRIAHPSLHHLADRLGVLQIRQAFGDKGKSTHSRSLTQGSALEIVEGAIPRGAGAGHRRAMAGKTLTAIKFHRCLLWISTRRRDFIRGFRKRLIGVAPLVPAWLPTTASCTPLGTTSLNLWGGGGNGGLGKGCGGCCCSPFRKDALNFFPPLCIHPLPCFFRLLAINA